MVDTTSLWAELRELLAEPSSPLTFRALLALLDTWPGEQQKQAIQTAAIHLEKWPDRDRVAPWTTAWALALGHTKPTWELVRRVELDNGDSSSLYRPGCFRNRVSFPKLAGRAELRSVAELCLDRFARGATVAFRDTSENLPTLTVFSGWGEYDIALQSLADLPVWGRMRELHVGSVQDSLWHSGPISFVPETLPDPAPLEAVTLHAPDLIALWERQSLPHLHTASVLITTAEDAERLAARPELAGLTELTLAFRCGRNEASSWGPFLGNVIPEDDEAAEAFFSKARLTELTGLGIIGYSMGYWSREGMGVDGLKAVIRNGVLRRLGRLRLELLPLGDVGVEALVEALPAERLEALELVDVYCRTAGGEALARSRALQAVEKLDLCANRIGEDGVCLLAETPMSRLRNLNLSGPPCNPYYKCVGQQPVGDGGAAAWAVSPNADTLQELRLRNACLTDAGLQSLANSSRLALLSELDVSHSVFTPDGLGALATATLWHSLRELRLNDVRLDDAGIIALTHTRETPRLRSLQLAYNSIGPDGATALAVWPSLERLWELNLHDNVIGDAGLVALARSPLAARLLELDLEQDCWNSRQHVFDDEVAQALADARFARMDALFSGVVDEYHGAKYSTGFTKEGWQLLNQSLNFRPELKASLQIVEIQGTDEVEEDEIEEDEIEEVGEDSEDDSMISDEELFNPAEHDFRNYVRECTDETDETDEEESSSGLQRI